MLGSGISSEAIWTAFDSIATANVRKVIGVCWVAWTRIADVSNYAIVGTSTVGGTDIIQGTDSASINNADSFIYFDESAKVIRIEYERTLLEPLGGMSIAMCDIVLDNSDLRFTPDKNSTIGTAIRPNRPMKVFIGFHVQGQDKTIPIIEGLTLQPREDKQRRTVSITAYDYLKWLNEKPQETSIYQNQRSDEIIADILSRAGVGSSNYSLDQGLNTIGFAWFEKGDTAGDRIRKIVEAEEGIFYQDENGILRFENRDKYSKSPYSSSVWDIDVDDILDWRQDFSSQIINRAIIKGSPRSVKSESEVWRNGIVEFVQAGQSITIFADFEDPVSSITNPASTTDYKAFANEDGTGTDLTADISITLTSFTKGAKLVIENTGGTDAYVTFLRLRATPATVDYQIQQIFQDTNSISDYNENQFTMDNEYIDDKDFASNMAQDIVRRHKLPTERIIITIRGLPHLQLRDQVRVYDQDISAYKNYRVLRIQGILEGGGFIQHLTLREITDNEAL